MDDRDLTGRCGTCGFYIALRTTDRGQEGECRLGCWPPPLRDTATCTHHKPKGQSFQGALKRKAAAGTPRRMREAANEPPPKKPLPQEIDIDMDQAEFRRVIREVLLDELGVGDVELADRWQGGEVVIKSPREGVKEKTIPIDQLFKKIVMVRDKLRVLEQKVNANKKLGDDEKVQLQQYITGCYGSLTTFNALFRERADWFVGQSSQD